MEVPTSSWRMENDQRAAAGPAVAINTGTVSLSNSKLFIGRSCPILVLTTILDRPRRADVKNCVKDCQRPKTKAFRRRF